jgi:hypothetical protein
VNTSPRGLLRGGLGGLLVSFETTVSTRRIRGSTPDQNDTIDHHELSKALRPDVLDEPVAKTGASVGTSVIAIGCQLMRNDQKTVIPDLRVLLSIEVADIVTTANQHGFATRDILVRTGAAVAGSMKALEEVPEPADDLALSGNSVPSPDLVEGIDA